MNDYRLRFLVFGLKKNEISFPPKMISGTSIKNIPP